ncbi:sensor histidine kinase [uncultured Friedmanniella sp.]|uniref:sensor histidine kinase n=1 Tax=uncultured Friedmanniella sp. TaxID=335381 RepID=UPI0035CB30CD
MSYADAVATPVDPPTAGQAAAPLGRGTLGRQLVIRVTALVALAAILLSAATALATRQLLLNQINDQLDGVSTRAQRADPRGQGPRLQLLAPGQPAGSLAAALTNDGSTSVGQVLDDDGNAPDLPADVLEAIGTLPVGTGKQSVQLVGLGHYRVVGRSVNIVVNGEIVPGRAYWGLSLNEMDHTLFELIGLELVLTLLAMAGAVLAARAVVLRSLRPLNRVAATAQQVSQLPLDRGEVALAVRVPEADADPTSEVGRVGQALNHMLNNVEDALEARQASETKVRRFVADASHELRNPLAAIRGYAELTRRSRSEMPADAAYAMSRVESEAERMSRLVEDLLLLARLDSGPAIEVEPADVTEIVINAVSDARVAGPEHTWMLSLPEEPVLALGDRHRLHQVVANLLANARTHTPSGTRVETAIELREGQAVIRVTDNGPGIPSDIRDNVFERFTRADTSRVRAEGATSGTSTGLGLAIVAAVVEAHQGRVTVSSVSGRTEFSVWLPLAAGPGPVEPTAPLEPDEPVEPVHSAEPAVPVPPVPTGPHPFSRG